MAEYYNSKCVKHAHHLKTENLMRILVVDICQSLKYYLQLGSKMGQKIVLLYILFIPLILKYR